MRYPPPPHTHTHYGTEWVKLSKFNRKCKTLIYSKQIFSVRYSGQLTTIIFLTIPSKAPRNLVTKLKLKGDKSRYTTSILKVFFVGFKEDLFFFPNKILKGFLFFSIFQNPVVLFLADISEKAIWFEL